MLVARLTPCPSYDILLRAFSANNTTARRLMLRKVYIYWYIAGTRRRYQAERSRLGIQWEAESGAGWAALALCWLVSQARLHTNRLRDCASCRRNRACAVLHLQLHQPITVFTQAMHKVHIHPSNRL
jgi:hypothetical protein